MKLRIGNWELGIGEPEPPASPAPIAHESRFRADQIRLAFREHAEFVLGVLDDVLCEEIKRAASDAALAHSLMQADANGRAALASAEELHRRGAKLETLAALRVELAARVAEAKQELKGES